MTIARTSFSAAALRSASVTSPITSRLSAFRFSGRFSVIRAAGGASSSRTDCSAATSTQEA
jgi:hypothetical protein